jgi:hypothetical protein
MLKESWKIIIRAGQAIEAQVISIPKNNPDMRQTCKICGRADKFDFNVPNRVWRAVVPQQFRKLVVCLSCFDELARQRNINYASYLQRLYFVGDKACFEFNVVNASELKNNRTLLSKQRINQSLDNSINHAASKGIIIS